MAKIDWNERLEQFAQAHLSDGVTPREWCESVGISFSSAKRYITIRKAEANGLLQKRKAKRAPNAKKVRKVIERVAAKTDCDVMPTIEPPQKPKSAVSMKLIGNQNARKHGAYSKFFTDEAMTLAAQATLSDELLSARAALVTAHMALEDIQRDLNNCDDANSQLRADLHTAKAKTLNAIERLTGRVAALSKDIAQIPLIVATETKTIVDTDRIRAATDKLRADIERMGRDGEVVTTPISQIVSDIQGADSDGLLSE